MYRWQCVETKLFFFFRFKRVTEARSFTRASGTARAARWNPAEKARGSALWDLHGIDLSFNESARDAFAGERKNGVAVDGTNDNKISILTNIRPPKNSQNSAERPTTTPQRGIYPADRWSMARADFAASVKSYSRPLFYRTARSCPRARACVRTWVRACVRACTRRHKRNDSVCVHAWHCVYDDTRAATYALTCVGGWFFKAHNNGKSTPRCLGPR